MQLIVLIAALVGITTSQRTYLKPENVTKVPATNVCLQGKNQDYVDQHCTDAQDMCITSSTISSGVHRIIKSCTNTEECLLQQRSGEKLCTGFDPSKTRESTCHVCCVGDRCNFFNTIPDLEEAYNVISRIKLAP